MKTINNQNRKSIRFNNYNYAKNGTYFITLCTQNREHTFGTITNRTMILNDLGSFVQKTWHDLPNHNPSVDLNAFVIMPNHIHGVVVIESKRADMGHFGTGLEPGPTHGLTEIVRQLKTFSSKRINQFRQTPGIQVWQRNYFEHIIRNDEEWNSVREYIMFNPAKWDEDVENEQRIIIPHIQCPWSPP
ncbi:MAG: transposase [Desulfobacteraceae bacterium]|jgi:REP element-mobilizing transposase RayT